MSDSPGLPAHAAGWVRSVVGAGWRIRGVRPLEASSSTVLAVELGRGSARQCLVLRLHDQAWFLEEGASALAREAAALSVAAAAGLPAPRLVAWSNRRPAALLMTTLPGAPELLIPDPGAVRDVLERIHALPTASLAEWSYRAYHEGITVTRPSWWRDAATWERVARLAGAPPDIAEPVVIHRDFHPGNLLWVEGRLGGVVDWVEACVGPAAIDVSHMRVNLAVLHGPVVADGVIAGDPAWDLEAALGFLDWSPPGAVDGWAGPWPHLPADVARARLEAFVSGALARLR